MNFYKRIIFYLFPVFLCIISCGKETTDQNAELLKAHISAIKNSYVSDSRLTLFQVKADQTENGYILRGETTNPEILKALRQKLQAENIRFTDSVTLLPDPKALNQKVHGVVKISVANLRDEPRHSAQLVTQANLGTPLKIYKKKGGWYYVQTPDGYLAWVDYGGIQNMTETEFLTWKEADKIIIAQTTTRSYSEKSTNAQTVSDLVAGNILELVNENDNFYEVVYPDTRRAFVRKTDAQPYQDWVSSLNKNKENLVTTAKKLMGLPYLWGGTSPKGVDCSGYTKTIFFLNGMIIPRDASQQIRAGKVVDTSKNFDALVKGDLLFFGKPATDSTAERVIHVGMWIGNNEFIHSMGQVHISSFDTTSVDFDEYNYKRYLRTKRIFNEEDAGLIYLKDANIFRSAKTSKDSLIF